MSQSNPPLGTPAEVRELRAYLRTIGDTLRLQILRQLARRGEMSVSELVRLLRASQPLLSWHLGVLRRYRLVTVRRQGRMVWYSLNRDSFHAFRKRLDAWIDGDGEDGNKDEGDRDV